MRLIYQLENTAVLEGRLHNLITMYDPGMTSRSARRYMPDAERRKHIMPGVKAGLKQVRRDGHSVALISQHSPRVIAATLQLTGLEHHFGQRVYSVQSGSPKSYTAAFNQICHALENDVANEMNTSQCVMIAHHPDLIRAAKRRGMHAIGFAHNCEPPGNDELTTLYLLNAVGADIVCHDHQQVLQHVRKLPHPGGGKSSAPSLAP